MCGNTSSLLCYLSLLCVIVCFIYPQGILESSLTSISRVNLSCLVEGGSFGPLVEFVH
jgi:hypothetical protein